ncbi:MAG: family 10 glycosylhydrolase, partial [Clostridiales bacterium]|nr:family 10 glycosylhydrolase [Clostridiales bacterium]
MKLEWYKEAYNRNSIDMHISDDFPQFMMQFDAGRYVDMLKLARVESAVVYSHSHVGYTYFPTRYGRMHVNLKGRDILKEIIEKCHESNINVVVYFSLIFDTWAYDQHPDWRMVNSEGKDWAVYPRYGVCCINSPHYREYVANLSREICENYDFEGILFDMTSLPGVCYCQNCRTRYANEAGGDMPVIIDWFDRKWTALQRCRERWLTEFAALVTNTVKAVKPGVSVEHQAAGFSCNFGVGVSADLRDNSDFLQGDFYGGYIQGSMACKLFYNLTPNLPFGYETTSN